MNNKIKKNILEYLPDYYYPSIFDIPYDFFVSKGINALIFDLDNTLLSSSDKYLDLRTLNKIKEIKKKFKIFILSNTFRNKLKRVLCSNFDVSYIYLKWYQKKPCLYGFRQALNLLNVYHNQAIMIGDQLRTDILGAKKMKILSILVNPINKKSESVFSKFNRFFFEKPVINYIKKKHYQIYIEKFKNFVDF
ncbi:YqeG family HAD IIIA-type phosphatase [Candidatus Phytoplasma oryzae]|nr:YqeG family HAD IIIA-type phosphatase [Candidatus Phytoplasma oryzae]